MDKCQQQIEDEAVLGVKNFILGKLPKHYLSMTYQEKLVDRHVKAKLRRHYGVKPDGMRPIIWSEEYELAASKSRVSLPVKKLD